MSVDHAGRGLICHERQYKRRAYSHPAENSFQPYTKPVGDIDLQAILPILVASSVMLAPILNWSIQIRENARAIAVFWGLLIFTALVPTCLTIWSGATLRYNQDQVFTCDIDIAKNCFSEKAVNITSSDFYKKWVCNCHR